MDKIKNQLAGVAALLGVIAAIGGGFIKYGEIQTKLDALSNQTAPDLSDMENNTTAIAVLEKEVQLLNLQLKELKISNSNPLQ